MMINHAFVFDFRTGRGDPLPHLRQRRRGGWGGVPVLLEAVSAD